MPDRWGLVGASSAELRQMYIDWHLLPCLREMVRLAPKTREVLVCVAQFYNDNANDEVHVLPLLLAEPWDGLWPVQAPPAYLDAASADMARDWFDSEEEWQACRSAPEQQAFALREWAWACHFQLTDAERRPWRPPLGYLSPAPAFAAFCKPGAGQHEPIAASYVPILHLKLPDGSLRWVGEMLQPEVEDSFLCNTVREDRRRSTTPALQAIPLAALRVVPEIEGRVRDFLDACLAFGGQGAVAEAAAKTFRTWADKAVGDHNDSPW